MARVNQETDIKPLAEINIAACIEQVHKTGRPLVITEQGQNAAVLLDMAVYESLIERLALLEDIRTAESQIAEGKLISQEDMEKSLLERFK